MICAANGGDDGGQHVPAGTAGRRWTSVVTTFACDGGSSVERATADQPRAAVAVEHRRLLAVDVG